MRKFISRIILFLILMGIVYAITAFGFSRLEQRAKGENGRLIYIHDQLAADSIIMGSSRALHHYNPVLLGNYYNVGEDRMGILFNYGRLLLLKQRHMPKMIIYDVEPDYDLLSDDNSAYLASLRPYYHRQGISELFSDVDSTEPIKMLFPFYTYNGRLMKLLADCQHPSMTYDKGYSPYEGCEEIIPEKLPQDKHDPLKYQYLQKLIDLCKQTHTRLVFTASPQLSYRSDSVYHVFKKICREEKIPFLNHFCDSQYTRHLAHFHNANHLNREGADMYSKEIREEINNKRDYETLFKRKHIINQ